MAGGRPTKLTPELQEELVHVIRAGNYVETACAFVGITKETFYAWLRRAAKERERLTKNPRARLRKSEVIYVEFSDAIKKAQGHSEIRDVMLIGKAAENQWQAAAWRLERKFPDRWGRNRSGRADEGFTHEQAVAIADMINKPAKDRDLAEFMTEGLEEDDDEGLDQ